LTEICTSALRVVDEKQRSAKNASATRRNDFTLFLLERRSGEGSGTSLAVV
jgi:hypothetical protein